jgi:Nop53 (60S ribosomal biogenesis)
MGKRIQGAKRRALQRSKDALDALQEQQAEAATLTKDIFVVDRVGNNKVHAVLNKKPQATKFQRNQLSKIDAQKVDSLLRKKHSSGGVVSTKAPSIRRRASSKPKMDLWDNSPTNDTAKPSSEESSVAPRKLTAEAIRNVVTSTAASIGGTIAKMTQSVLGATWAGIAPVHTVTQAKTKENPVLPVTTVDTRLTPGQSYHPDPSAYQQLLQTAVQVEVARNQAQQKTETPISQGMSSETRALLIGDSDSDDDDDCNVDGTKEEHSTTNETAMILPKRTGKLTTAQRNKQKQRRMQEAILKKQQQTKRLLKDIDGELPRFQKEIKRKELLRLQKQEARRLQLQQTPRLPLELHLAQTNPLAAPTVPIALAPELRSSLRTIKPKGSLVQERALLRWNPPTAETKKKAHKRRKLSLKGKRNSATRGDNFEILG